MQPLSALRPVSPRELLILAESNLGRIADRQPGDALRPADLTRIASTLQILKVLIDAQPTREQEMVARLRADT